MLQKENKMNGIEKLIPQSGYMEVHFEGNPKRIENMSYSSLINFIDRATVEKESIKVFPNHAGVSTISYLKSGGAEHIFLKRSAETLSTSSTGYIQFPVLHLYSHSQ